MKFQKVLIAVDNSPHSSEAAQVGFELAERREVPAREKQRRQEDEEDEVRWQLELGESRDGAEHEPAEDHHDRVRDRETARDDRERGDEDEQEENELDVAHRC